MEGVERPGADTIVVGIDGSASGRLAVRWAVDEARRRHLRLHLVQVVEPGPGATSPVGAEALGGELAAARETLATLAHDPANGLDVTGAVYCGAPGWVLVDAAADAAMLVVGPRRHGRIGSALLGSVSNYCTHHCRCPVVVVAQAAAPVS